jgi:hypothetical protein
MVSRGASLHIWVCSAQWCAKRSVHSATTPASTAHTIPSSCCTCCSHIIRPHHTAIAHGLRLPNSTPTTTRGNLEGVLGCVLLAETAAAHARAALRCCSQASASVSAGSAPALQAGLVGCHSLMSLMPPAGTLQLLSACTTDDSYSTVCDDVALCSLHVHGEHVVTVYIAYGILAYNTMVAPSVEPCQFPGRLAVLLGQVTGLTEAAEFDRFLKLQLPCRYSGQRQAASFMASGLC